MDFKKTYRDIFSNIDDYCYKSIDTSEYKHSWLIDLVKTYNPKSVVDIGSGRGAMLSYFIGSDTEVLATDLDNFLAYDFPFKEINLLYELKLDKVYDLLICCDVIEHLPIPESIELLDKLKPYGKIFLIAIANHSDTYSDPQGQEIHLTQKNKNFWDTEIKNRFKIIKSDTFRNNQLYMYILEPI